MASVPRTAADERVQPRAASGADRPESGDGPLACDVLVVGAGPAGSAAAIAAARAGASVVMLERGPAPGSKNMYGGVVYGRVLDGLIPNWWESAPVERWVTRRQTMMLTDTQAMIVDFRTQAWSEPPYNGATALRPVFDRWLADEAERAGAQVVCSTTAIGLLRDANNAVVGVRTDRPDGDLRAKVVIACDGVNSFLAKEAGLYSVASQQPENFTVGVKETLALGRDVIDQRFGVRGDDGVDIEIIGCTGNIPGGGFVYTNRETVSVGLVLSLPALASGKVRAEELLAKLKAHPAVAPLVEGGTVLEYSAHVIPEAGFDMMPHLFGDGILVAGDAAAMCLAAGIWLEGVNFAIGSGMAAGAAAAQAVARGECDAQSLGTYRDRLESSFVLKDHRRLRNAPHLVMSERVQQQYPAMVCNIVESVFRVENPQPKPPIRQIVRREAKKAGVKTTDLIRDLWAGARTFG